MVRVGVISMREKMLKKIKNLLFITSFIFIFLGILLIFYNVDKKETKNSYIVVNTSKKIGDKIENITYDEYEITNSYSNYAFRSKDINIANRYEFSFPETLNNRLLSDTNISMGNNNININTNCMYSVNIDEYKKSIVDEYNSDNYSKYNISSSQDNLQIDGVDIEYLKIEAIDKLIMDDESESNLYTERFIVLLKESENSVCSISYLTYSKRFSDEFLSEIINKIDIKNKQATYLYSTIKDNSIIGSLNQKKLKTSDKYELYYSLPSDEYEEIVDDRNNIYSTTFRSKKSNMVVNISLESMLDSDFSETLYLENLKNEISNSEENMLINISGNTVIYEDREYFSIDLSYKNDLNLMVYREYLISKLENDIYYIVIFEDENFIEEEQIESFLRFDLKNIK